MNHFKGHIGHVHEHGRHGADYPHGHDRAFEVSALDPETPVDSVPISQLAAYIRDAKRAMHKLTIVPAKFEAGTESGDLVHLKYTDQTWYRSVAGVNRLERFAGVAFPELRGVLIGPAVMFASWHWTPGTILYLSETVPGKMQTERTSIIAGFAVHPQLVLLNIGNSIVTGTLENILDQMLDIEEYVRNTYVEITTIVDRVESALADAQAIVEYIENLRREIEAIAASLQAIVDAGQVIKDEMDKLFGDTKLIADEIRKLFEDFEFYQSDINSIYCRLNFLEELTFRTHVFHRDWGHVTSEPVCEADWGSVEDVPDTSDDFGDVALARLCPSDCECVDFSNAAVASYSDLSYGS